MSLIFPEGWQVPRYIELSFKPRSTEFCVLIPVINEGERLALLLQRIHKIGIAALADILIVDGGSKDGSIHPLQLEPFGVRSLITKTDSGRLSAQLRCGYAYACLEGYQGIVTIDGNNKDDPSAIPDFLVALLQGADFVQGSRFIVGGHQANTPRSRDLAIRYLHAPMLRWFSGFAWTDTTQGFRAYSRQILIDQNVAPFRSVFTGYELLAYLSYRIPKLGYRCLELPTSRCYPIGEVPTKISGFSGNLNLFKVLVNACLGRYNPSRSMQKL